MNLEPITLEGDHVRLVPLAAEHAALLWEAAKNDHANIFRWYTDRLASSDDLRIYVDKALAERAAGVSLPFATIEKPSGRVVGTTRFMNIDRAHKRAEIGNTWIATPYQRTAINTEAKLLMLRHAFEAWKCIRVELKTDALNEKSRAAILRLGAKEEGTLRHHFVTHTGRLRDSVYFSILTAEWPQVKAGLEAKLHD